MTFDELLTSVVDLLRRQGRVSYGALRRRFDLDEAYLQDLKDELIAAQRIAADEGGRILVWVGSSTVASSPQPSVRQTPNSEGSPAASPKPLDTSHSTLHAPRAASESEQHQLTTVVGPPDREGMPEPVSVYPLNTRTPVPEREEEPPKSQMLPLVGREEELRLFLKRWEQVQE